MSKYSTLKAEIIASIKRNGAQAITGDLLQEKLLSMIDSLGEFYQFGGLALPSTEFTPGDEPVVFIAATPGTYTNFGGLVVADNEVALLVWSGSAWSKQTTDIATRSEVSQLGQKVDGVTASNRATNKVLNEDGTTSSISVVTSVVDTFDVVGGRTYIISGRVTDLSGTCLVAFYEGETFIAGSSAYPSTGTPTPYHNITVVAPLNATQMKVYGNTNADLPYSPSAVVYIREKSIGENVDEIQQNVDEIQQGISNLKSGLWKQVVTNRTTYTDTSLTFKADIHSVIAFQREPGGAISTISPGAVTYSLSGSQRLVLHANNTLEVVAGATNIVETDIVLLGLNADTGRFGHGALYSEYLDRAITKVGPTEVFVTRELVQGNASNKGVIPVDSYYNKRVSCVVPLNNFSSSGAVLHARVEPDKIIRNAALYNSTTDQTSNWLFPNGNSSNTISYAFQDGENRYDTLILTVAYSDLTTDITPNNVSELAVRGYFAVLIAIHDTVLENVDNPFYGKNYSVMGDSIGTNNTGDDAAFTITANDAGKSITSWITWYDYNNSREDTPSGTTKTIGGVAITSAMVGTQQTFIPTNEDIGKTLGTPRWAYNQQYSTKPWWKILGEKLGMTLNSSASWNGNSYCSHEENDNLRKIGYGWHPLQIQRLAKRDADGNRVAPDYIFLCRGTNDATHSPYAKITDFGSGIDTIPADDTVTGGYGFKEALARTISAIQTTYPKAKIFVSTLTPLRRLSDDTFPMDNGTNTMQDYNKAVEEVAEYMGVNVIDFSKCWTFYNCASEGYVNNSDKTHPLQKGHNAMAVQAEKDVMK